MQPGTYSLERSLEDCVNHAIQKAVKNPCGIDPFGSELRAAMDTFASSLPSCLQKDRITTRETLPASRKVTVTSVSNEDQNKKSSHPLISSVNQGVLVLNQPIFYTVKKGDTLSEISWKLTGRKASVRDLKNWNTIWDDNIKPGQVLYLADPYDSFVKEIASKLSKHELTGRNPKVSLDRLSDEMVAQHGGLFREKHQVEIQLEFREPWEEFLNLATVPQKPYEGPWNLDESFNQDMFQELTSNDQNGNDDFNFSELGSSIKSTLSYLDSFVKGGGYGFYNSERTAHSILKGRTPDGLFTENIIDPFKMGIVFNKPNLSFGPNRFKYVSKPKENSVLKFELYVDFSSGVSHVINGIDSYKEVSKMLKGINIEDMTITSGSPNSIDTTYLKGGGTIRKSSFNRIEGGTRRALVNGDTINVPLKQKEIDELNKF